MTEGTVLAQLRGIHLPAHPGPPDAPPPLFAMSTLLSMK